MATANEHTGELDPAVKRLLAVAGWRHANGLVVTCCVVLVAILFLMFISDQLLIAVANLPHYLRGKAAWEHGQISWQEYLLVVQRGKTVSSFVLLYLGLYVLPVIVAMPVAAPLMFLWREPPLFLFLRPFNRRPLSVALSRATRKDLGRFGHIYTLADSSIFVPWYVRVPLLFGQLSLFAFRMRKVKREKQLIGIEKALGRTVLRNLNWCLSWRKTFAVASDDARWQQIVELLVRRSELIFMDLSDFKPNVIWELLLIRRLGLENRLIYFLRQDIGAENRQSVEQYLGDLSALGSLFYYDQRGALDREKLRTAIAAKLVALTPAQTRSERRGIQLASLAGVLFFMVGCLPILSLLVPAFQDKLQRMELPLHFALFIWSLVTWAYLGVISYWHRPMIYLALVQTFLVLVFLLSSI